MWSNLGSCVHNLHIQAVVYYKEIKTSFTSMLARNYLRCLSFNEIALVRYYFDVEWLLYCELMDDGLLWWRVTRMISMWISSEGGKPTLNVGKTVPKTESWDGAKWKKEETRGQKQTPFSHDQVCLVLCALSVATRLEPILAILHGGSRHSSLALGCIISLSF